MLWRPRILCVAILVAIALLPVFRMVYTLGVLGENNLSNDAAPFLSRFLSPVMAGRYHWLDFPRDTFINTHSNIFPALVFIFLAYLSHLEVHSILYLGVLLALVRLWLLKDVIVNSSPISTVMGRAALWLALASLVFSISQMSVYEFPLLSIKYGLSNLGTAFGVWVLVRFRGRMTAVWLAAIAGVVATLSNATGFALWPAFLIGMWLLGLRKLQHIMVLLAGAAVSVIPYILFLFLSTSRPAGSMVVSVFKPMVILNILGRPFANKIGTDFGRLPMSEAAALIGLILCVSAAVILWGRRRRRPFSSAAPMIILVAVGVLTCCQISLFRSQISPWYTGVVMDFWIGLVGLAYLFWMEDSSGAAATTRRMATSPAGAWSIAAVACIAVLYLASNCTRTDKSFYVYSRSPVSAACLRNYRTAPTYCECSLVHWQPGNPSYMEMLGRPLEENNLSVFASPEEWSLQGDTILGNVQYNQALGAPDIHWAAGIGGDRTPITDYRKLDLVLEAPNSVSWTVALPTNLENAEFQSAVAACLDHSSAESRRVTCKVRIQTAEQAETVVFSRSLGAGECWWNGFRIPLNHYTGQTITIRLAAEGQGQGARAMFQYPSVLVFLKERKGQQIDLGATVPSNTDRSSRFTKTTPDDYLFKLQDASLWDTGGSGRTSQEPPGTWSMANADSLLRYIGPLSLPVSDYSHLYVRVAASDDVLPRALLATFSYNGEHGPGEDQLTVIPLLAGPGLHAYTFDLTLLDLSSSARVTGIALQPLLAGMTAGEPLLQISDLRFIRKPLETHSISESGKEP